MQLAESRWQALIDAAVDGMIVIDARGTIEAFNLSAERIFGYPAAEVLGHPLNAVTWLSAALGEIGPRRRQKQHDEEGQERIQPSPGDEEDEQDDARQHHAEEDQEEAGPVHGQALEGVEGQDQEDCGEDPRLTLVTEDGDIALPRKRIT